MIGVIVISCPILLTEGKTPLPPSTPMKKLCFYAIKVRKFSLTGMRWE